MSTWILLRGLTRERRHWGRFPDEMRKEMPGVRVITLDLPGNGELSTMRSPLNVTEMANCCRSAVMQEGVPPPYRLLAMSMGGMVATAWAERHPQEIDACVLVNTSFAAFSPLHHRLRARAWSMMLRLILARTAKHREEIVFRLTSNLAQPPAWLLDEWIVIRQLRPVSALNGLRQLFASAKFHAPTAAPVATLILASARDGLVDPRCSAEIARCWNCAIAVHSAAGHDLPLDDGAWVAEKIHEWLTLAVPQLTHKH
jgi:pimeloyl-ACP methyl ester carboxylesterase